MTTNLRDVCNKAAFLLDEKVVAVDDHQNTMEILAKVFSNPEMAALLAYLAKTIKIKR
jgi:hypothetical protein